MSGRAREAAAGRCPPGEIVLRLASACAALAAGLEVCVRHVRAGRTAAIVATLADAMKDVAAEAWSLGVRLGHERRRGARTCERMRWEWLASTASLLDGAPDIRLATECARVASSAHDDARLVAERLEPGPARRSADRIAAALGASVAALRDAMTPGALTDALARS